MEYVRKFIINLTHLFPFHLSWHFRDNFYQWKSPGKNNIIHYIIILYIMYNIISYYNNKVVKSDSYFMSLH